MGAKVHFTEVIKSIKRVTSRDKKSKEIPVDELTDSKFALTRNNILAERGASNSLLFQMYSSENEVLFV